MSRIEMEHQTDNTQHIESASNGNFEIVKLKILVAIDKIKGKKKHTDIDAIQKFIVQADATNIDKNTIKDFVTQLVAQKSLIKKNTSQGNYNHKTPTEEDLPQPPRHSIRTPTKENFNKTSEGESGTRINFIHNNIYVTNDDFEAFYEDYLEYKGYVNDILNTLIPKDDILHRIDKENTTEHSLKKSNRYKIK